MVQAQAPMPQQRMIPPQFPQGRSASPVPTPPSKAMAPSSMSPGSPSMCACRFQAPCLPMPEAFVPDSSLQQGMQMSPCRAQRMPAAPAPMPAPVPAPQCQVSWQPWEPPEEQVQSISASTRTIVPAVPPNTSPYVGAPQVLQPTPLPQPEACQVHIPAIPAVPAEGHLLGPAIRLPGGGDMDWQPPPSDPEVVYTSMHVLSQQVEKEKEEGNQQDILEHCRDTAKLVKQLASVLKGLEADVESLRRENHSLRKTVLAAVPQRFEEELPRPEEDEDEVWHPDQGSSIAASSSVPANPHQTRSTPPPSARLATPPVSQPQVAQVPQVPQVAQVAQAVQAVQAAQAAQAAQVLSQPHERMSQLSQGRSTPEPVAEVPPAGLYIGPPVAAKAMPAATSAAPKNRSGSKESAGSSQYSGMEGIDGRLVPAVPVPEIPVVQEEVSGPHMLTAPCETLPAVRPFAPCERQAALSPLVWAVEQAIWLGGESVDHLAGKAHMLDKESFSSASAAVDALNRGLLKLPDDFVVVFSGSSGGYYLLYRQGLCEQAMTLVEEAAPPKSQNTEGQVEPQLEGEPRQTMAVEIIELAEHDQPAKAEELMRQALQIGPVPEAYDSLVMAYERCDNIAKAEEWLWRALQSGIIPREECFGTVVVALCKQGAALKVEDTMAQMMHLRMRPPKEVFDKVIGLFAKQRNPIKVEEWLLNAGQSGWTPHQAAFEAVVKLYAEVDTMKAEEWLRRSQETQYRLPDTCYYPVIMGLLRNGNPQKAEDVLSMMKANEFPIDDVVLQEVIALHAEVGNCLRAENLLETMENPRSNLDDLRLGIIDSALRAGEIEVAERQVLLLADPEISRSKQVAAALSEAGDDSRAKAVLESHCAVSGEAPPDICTALLSVCAALGDLRGAEASAQLLLQSGPLSEAQVALLRQTLGDRAEDLLRAAPPAPPQKAAATSRGVNGTRSSRRMPAQRSQILGKNQKAGSTATSKSGSPKAAPKRTGTSSLSSVGRPMSVSSR